MNRASHPSWLSGLRTRGAVGRAFALPLVVLLALVATVLVSVMLERQGAQRMTIARAGSDYRSTHFARGVSEVVDSWLGYQVNRSLRDTLGADGKAMDIELADGTTLSVYLRDAQGLLLSDTAGLSPDDASELQGALDYLAESVDPAQLPALTRRLGPAPVSVLKAPVEVLSAIARQVGGAEKNEDLLHALLEIRDKPRPMAQDLTQAAVSADLDDTQRKALSRLVVVDSGFYRMTIDVRDANAGPDSAPIARYAAWALPRSMASARQRTTTAGGVMRRTQIVGWEQLEVRRTGG